MLYSRSAAVTSRLSRGGSLNSPSRPLPLSPPPKCLTVELKLFQSTSENSPSPQFFVHTSLEQALCSDCFEYYPKRIRGPRWKDLTLSFQPWKTTLEALELKTIPQRQCEVDDPGTSPFLFTAAINILAARIWETMHIGIYSSCAAL